MIYYWEKKLRARWCEFILDLDSVWVQITILLKNTLWLYTWKTKFLGKSSEGLFRTPSNRISHRIHIVSASCSQLPVRSGIFFIHEEVVYRPCGLKFVYPTINLAYMRIILKAKLPVKFCFHSFEWFCRQVSDPKYFPHLSKAVWSRIKSC